MRDKGSECGLLRIIVINKMKAVCACGDQSLRVHEYVRSGHHLEDSIKCNLGVRNISSRSRGYSRNQLPSMRAVNK